MRNYLKHLFCLSVIVFAIAIGSCKKNEVNSTSRLSQSQLDSIGRLDSIARADSLSLAFTTSIVDACSGSYTCAKHHYYQSGPPPNGYTDIVLSMDTILVTHLGAAVTINNTYHFNTISHIDSSSLYYSDYTNVSASAFAADFSLQNNVWSLTYYFNNTGTGLHPDYYYSIGQKIH